MTREGIIRILPTLGNEPLADNERAFIIFEEEISDKGESGLVTFKVTTDQLLSKDGFEVKYVPSLFTVIKKQETPVVVSPQTTIQQPTTATSDSDTVKVGEIITGTDENWPPATNN